MDMVLLWRLFLTFFVGQAQEEPPCVDLLQHQLHLENASMMAIDTGHVAQQAPAGPLVPVAPAPPPVPALTNPGLKANVVSYQLWQAKTQINLNVQNNINEAPPKEPSWEDGDKWANAIGASQGLAQSIQSCAATSSTATPGWTGSCINTIGNNALQVTSQVMMLADVCIPEGIVAAGVGEMVISLLFGGSSSSSPSPPPMNAQQLVDAVELGTLSTTCTLMSNSVQDVIASLQTILSATSQNYWSVSNWDTWTGSSPQSILYAQQQLLTFAQDCIQTYAQTTFLKSTSDFVGSFSPQCKSTCGTEDAYNQHYTACSGGAQQLNQWLTTWDANVQLFLNATSLFGAARSAVQAIARANVLDYTLSEVNTYKNFIASTQSLTPWVLLLTKLQHDMCDHCYGSQQWPIIKCSGSGSQEQREKMITLMGQMVTNTLKGFDDMGLTTSVDTSWVDLPCKSCPPGWIPVGKCEQTNPGAAWFDGGTQSCVSSCGCMEHVNKGCYKVFADLANQNPWPLPPLPSPPATGPPIRINVTMIQHNGLCVHHTSKALLHSCSSSSDKKLFAVMSQNFLFPDPSSSTPISSTSEPYCFFAKEGALDIGTGSDCQSGWQFQHVAANGAGSPPGTWPVQIVANGLCWTVSGSSLVLSKCAQASAQQTFVLVQP